MSFGSVSFGSGGFGVLAEQCELVAKRRRALAEVVEFGFNGGSGDD